MDGAEEAMRKACDEFVASTAGVIEAIGASDIGERAARIDAAIQAFDDRYAQFRAAGDRARDLVRGGLSRVLAEREQRDGSTPRVVPGNAKLKDIVIDDPPDEENNKNKASSSSSSPREKDEASKTRTTSGGSNDYPSLQTTAGKSEDANE